MCIRDREKAQQAQNDGAKDDQQTTSTTTENDQVAVTPVTPVQTPVATDHSDVRTIDGETNVTKGSPLKTYSVVVGSFVTQVNAEGLYERLTSEGYDARVLKTNETINGKTGWFRVIASSSDDKSTSVQSRNALRSKFPGTWLLFRK